MPCINLYVLFILKEEMNRFPDSQIILFFQSETNKGSKASGNKCIWGKEAFVHLSLPGLLYFGSHASVS